MGFGPVIAVALCLVVLITAGYVIIGGMAQSSDATASALKDSGDLKVLQHGTALTIDGAAGFQNGTLLFAVHNTGNEKIVNISQMDVILEFTQPLNVSPFANWVPYAASPGQSPALNWTAASISDDSINPGMLDPGETLNAVAQDPSGFPEGTGTIVVAAPNGVTASSIFIITE